MEFLNGGDLEFHLKEQIMFSERIVRYYSAEIIFWSRTKSDSAKKINLFDL